MPDLPVNTLMDGLILAANVVDAAGNVIVPAGAVVNHSVRNRLLHAKVARVLVTEESYGLSALLEPATPSKTSVRPAPAKAAAPAKPAPAARTAPPPVKGERESDNAPKKSDTVAVQEQLMRLAHMFAPHREDPLMRELLRLAIKCAQERLISV